MQSVGVRELKERLSHILRRVRTEGEVVEITYYGDVVARLIPAGETSPAEEDVEAFLTDLDSLAAEIGRRWSGEPSAEEAVHDVRRDL